MVSKTKSKSKIIEVSLDNTSLSFEDNEPETEAQEMDKVIDEIKTETHTEPQTNETELEPIQEEPKAKAKSKARAKAKLVKPVEPVEPVKPVEEVKPVEKKKAELVECPNCKKKLTAKTLQYNHVHNCPANKFKEPEKLTITSPNVPITPPVETPIIQDNEPIIKRPTTRDIRNMKRDRMINSLISQAF
jgi:hypothetical protein